VLSPNGVRRAAARDRLADASAEPDDLHHGPSRFNQLGEGLREAFDAEAARLDGALPFRSGS